MHPASKLFQVTCALTSSIFNLYFFGTLAIFGLFKTMATPRPRHKSPDMPLSREQNKLVFDLGYYVNLEGFRHDAFKVVTSDGYVLDCAHISEWIPTNDKPKYPVLLIPGLMQSSAAYCTCGPNSIAYTLCRMGYDVWLGNNRGGFHGEHETYSRWRTNKMWDWDMKDLATKDVPSMINFVLKETGHEHLAVVGHSQGTAQTFLALSKSCHPDLGKKISSFVALAPAVYAGSLIDRWYLKLLRRGRHAFRLMMGFGPFLGPMGVLHKMLPLITSTYFGYVMFNYLLGWNDSLWDLRYRDRNFIFAPTYVSSELMMWWLGKGGFADTKCLFDESKHSWFDERFPKLALFVCGKDELCLGEKLIHRLQTQETVVDFTSFELPTYSHLDVLWARDADVQVARPLGKFIAQNIQSKDQWNPIS